MAEPCGFGLSESFIVAIEIRATKDFRSCIGPIILAWQPENDRKQRLLKLHKVHVMKPGLIPVVIPATPVFNAQ